MTGEQLKELNLYKLRLARKIVTGVLPLNRDESLLILAAAKAIDALVSVNDGNPDETDF
jgi:hypothetical protein